MGHSESSVEGRSTFGPRSAFKASWKIETLTFRPGLPGATWFDDAHTALGRPASAVKAGPPLAMETDRPQTTPHASFTACAPWERR